MIATEIQIDIEVFLDGNFPDWASAGVIDSLAIEDGQKHFGGIDLLYRNFKEILAEHNHVGPFAHFYAAHLLFNIHQVG